MNNYHHKTPNLEEIEASLLALKMKIHNQIRETGELIAEAKNMEYNQERVSQAFIYKK